MAAQLHAATNPLSSYSHIYKKNETTRRIISFFSFHYFFASRSRISIRSFSSAEGSGGAGSSFFSSSLAFLALARR